MIEIRSGTTLRGIVPWLAATGLLLLCEAQLVSHRSWSAAVPNGKAAPAALSPELKHREISVNAERVCLSEVMSHHRSAIVVVGCVNAENESEFEVALTIEPSAFGKEAVAAARDMSPEKSRVEVEANKGFTASDSTSQSQVPTTSATRPSMPPVEPTRRVFFLDSPRAAPNNASSHLGLNCRLAGESDWIRVYVDQPMNGQTRIESQVAELIRLADELIGPRISLLVGPVSDCDADGKLAVVLSQQLDQPDGCWAGVEGLTRASDFRPEVPRPFGNQADVIFLSSHLQPGERLRAIFAHEWAHAAIFSRRYRTDSVESEPTATEDDWLNEGLTHLIEVRVSGTSANVQHRTRAFLDRPEAAPLLVRDYAQPQFWRHHGCRGAAFSFLNWCHSRCGPRFVDRLIVGRDVGVEHFERAAGLTFEQLFREWTVSMGQTVARQEEAHKEALHREDDSQPKQVAPHDSRDSPMIRDWHAADRQPRRAMTLRLRETTAAYVKICLADCEIGGDLVATSPVGNRLQLTVIPIETEANASATADIETMPK